MSTKAAATAVPTDPDSSVPFQVRVLRRLKPLVVALLASPLHGLMSRDVLLLSWKGRRSGRLFTLPISYVEHAGRLYMCTRGSGWWRNVANAPVEILLRGTRRSAVATLLDSSSDEALEGLRAFLTRNPGTGRLLYEVGTQPDGKPGEADLAREVLKSVVVRLDVS